MFLFTNYKLTDAINYKLDYKLHFLEIIFSDFNVPETHLIDMESEFS